MCPAPAVVSAAPLLPAGLLRAFAREAGVHLYIDTPDVVWACRDMIGVSVYQPGERVVRLPRPRSVRDLYADVHVAGDAAEFRTEFAERATRVFVLE